MIQRENTTGNPAHRDLPNPGEVNDIPRRVRLSSREIGVAVALTAAALIQLFWSLTKPDDRLTSVSPDPSAISRHAR